MNEEYRVVRATGRQEIAILLNMPERVLPDQRQVTIGSTSHLSRIERALRGHRMKVTGIEHRESAFVHDGHSYPLVVVNVKEAKRV